MGPQLVRRVDHGLLDLLRQVSAGWRRSGDGVRNALLGLLDQDLAAEDVRAVSEVLAGFEPTADERAQVLRLLVDLLEDWWTSQEEVIELAEAMAALATSDQERLEAREELIDIFDRHGITSSYSSPGEALWVVDILSRLEATPKERRWLQDGLLTVLSRRTAMGPITELAETAVGLDPTPQARARAQSVLRRRLASATDKPWNNEAVNNPGEEPGTAFELAKTMMGLAVTPKAREKVREEVIKLLHLASAVGRSPSPHFAVNGQARRLAGTVAVQGS